MKLNLKQSESYFSKVKINLFEFSRDLDLNEIDIALFVQPISQGFYIYLAKYTFRELDVGLTEDLARVSSPSKSLEEKLTPQLNSRSLILSNYFKVNKCYTGNNELADKLLLYTQFRDLLDTNT